MTDVSVVDLGLGNLHSVLQALERAGACPSRITQPEDVRSASRIVVPGQGAFRDCAAALEGGVGEALRERLEAGIPYLGICLGMQLLFEESEEAPGAKGLGWFRGTVRRLPSDRQASDGRAAKVPQMGWNQVRGEHPLIDDGGWYYFVHSYYCDPDESDVRVGQTLFGGEESGLRFCSAVAEGSLFACQYHPEKSQRRGERLLRRFLSVRAQENASWS